MFGIFRFILGFLWIFVGFFWGVYEDFFEWTTPRLRHSSLGGSAFYWMAVASIMVSRSGRNGYLLGVRVVVNDPWPKLRATALPSRITAPRKQVEIFRLPAGVLSPDTHRRSGADWCHHHIGSLVSSIDSPAIRWTCGPIKTRGVFTGKNKKTKTRKKNKKNPKIRIL